MLTVLKLLKAKWLKNTSKDILLIWWKKRKESKTAKKLKIIDSKNLDLFNLAIIKLN